MESIKSYIAISMAAILAYFQPIHSVLEAITLLFVINFLVGLMAGLFANRECFDFKKAFRCITEASVLLFILASVFFIGDHAGAKGQALQAISTIAYALIYFYSVNIVKNLKQLLPKSRSIAFLYNLISIELIAKIPYLNNFLKDEAHENIN